MSFDKRKMIGAGRVLAALACGVIGVTAASAECVVPRGEGKVTLDCRAVPLGQVLRGLAAVAPIDSKLIEASALAAPIYVGMTDVPVGQALQAALDAAGVSFVLYGNDGELKVFASGRHSPGAAATRTASVRTGSAAPDPSDFVPDEVPEV